MGRRDRKGNGRPCLQKSFLLSCLVSLLSQVKYAHSQSITQEDASSYFTGCLEDLIAADDGDFFLKSNEYVTFIAIRSDGRLNYDDYKEMPLPLVSNFNFGACFCALAGADEQCCVGDNAGIILDPLVSDLVEDNLFTFCITVDDAVQSLLPVTLVPTASPVSGSPSPTTFSQSPPTLGPQSATPTTIVSSPSPSGSPTQSPTEPSPRPTSEDELCINFQYGIINNGGVDAKAILDMTNNTLKIGLIVATENVTIDILNASFPESENALRYRQRKDQGKKGTKYSGEHSQVASNNHTVVPLAVFGPNLPSAVIEFLGGTPNDRRLVYVPNSPNRDGTRQHSRRLVFYAASLPPQIDAVIDNPFNCPTDTPEVTRCAIVASTVCVFLEDGDDPTVVRDVLRRGLQTSIANGEFEAAIPEENRIVDLTL